MQEQKATKVTLYLPPDLHRQLKVQSALDGEAMSAIAERAIDFYLSNPEAVDENRLYGQTHRIHNCPACSTSLVLHDGELSQVSHLTSSAASSEGMSVGTQELPSDQRQPDEGELVVC